MNWLAVLAVAIGIAVAVWFLASLSQLDTAQSEKGRRQLEDALRKAAVACYAAEGIYPPTLDYLTEYYGIQIDDSRYTVFYEVFADNLMPEITVLEMHYE